MREEASLQISFSENKQKYFLFKLIKLEYTFLLICIKLVVVDWMHLERWVCQFWYIVAKKYKRKYHTVLFKIANKCYLNKYE